jgi:hypothetical protein
LTGSLPLPAGLVAVIETDELIVTLAAAVLPNLTVEPAMKPLPAMPTEAPPAAGPLFGLIDVTVGAVACAAVALPSAPVRQHSETTMTRRDICHIDIVRILSGGLEWSTDKLNGANERVVFAHPSRSPPPKSSRALRCATSAVVCACVNKTAQYVC